MLSRSLLLSPGRSRFKTPGCTVVENRLWKPSNCRAVELRTSTASVSVFAKWRKWRKRFREAIRPGEEQVNSVISLLKKGQSVLFIHFFVVSVPCFVVLFVTFGTVVDVRLFLHFLGLSNFTIVAEGGRLLIAYTTYKLLMPIRLMTTALITPILYSFPLTAKILEKIDNLKIPYTMNIRQAAVDSEEVDREEEKRNAEQEKRKAEEKARKQR